MRSFYPAVDGYLGGSRSIATSGFFRDRPRNTYYPSVAGYGYLSNALAAATDGYIYIPPPEINLAAVDGYGGGALAIAAWGYISDKAHNTLFIAMAGYNGGVLATATDGYIYSAEWLKRINSVCTDIPADTITVDDDGGSGNKKPKRYGPLSMLKIRADDEQVLEIIMVAMTRGII